MDNIRLKKFMLAINKFGTTPKYVAKLERGYGTMSVMMYWQEEPDTQWWQCYRVGYIEFITGRFEFVSAPAYGSPYSARAKDDIEDFLKKLCDKYNNLEESA